MTAATSTTTSVTTWLDRSRTYAPLAATLLGVLYASGFVIVNAYLARYGIRELDALRTRYVGAGLLFLVFLVLGFIVANQIRIDFHRRTGRARVLYGILGVVVGPALMSIAETLLIVRVGIGTFGTDPIDWFVASRLFVIFTAMNFALILGVLLFEAAQVSRSGPFEGRMFRGLASWWLVVVVLGVALAWSEIVYPQIPAFIGGGKPERVRLVTTQSVADACQPCVRENVLLLDADDKRIVVLATGADGRPFAVEIFLISGNDRAVIHEAR